MSTFVVSQGVLREIAQSLQEGKKMARSLENLVCSLSVLTDDENVRKGLTSIEESSKMSAEILSEIYKLIARDALGE